MVEVVRTVRQIFKMNIWDRISSVSTAVQCQKKPILFPHASYPTLANNIFSYPNQDLKNQDLKI